MKLPANVLMEALLPLGTWRFAGDRADAGYAFPRRWDASAGCAGHAVVLFPDDAPDREGGWLAVHTRPDAAVVPGRDALLPAAAADGAAVLDRLTALYDRMDAWAEALDECSSDLPGIQKMLDVTSREMGGSFGLIDESYNMPAYTASLAAGMGLHNAGAGSMRPSDESVLALAGDPQITAVRSLTGVRRYEGSDTGGVSLFRNMFREGESDYYNRLLFSRPSALYTQTDAFMIEHLARRIERVTRNLSTFSMPVSRYAALKQLIRLAAEPGGEPVSDHLDALSPLGWKRGDSFRFFLFRSVYDRRDAGVNEFLVRQLEQLLPGSCGVVDEGRILLVLNTSLGELPFRELRSRLAEFLRENMYKVGVSNEAVGFDRLRGAFLQARAAMDLGGARDPMFWYYLFEDYLSDYLLRKAAEDIPAEMLMLPALDTLRLHDRRRGTRFVETLQVYVRENFNVTHAARALYIHRTSFQDRMERIRALTGLDLDDEEVRFLLQFSFRLLNSPTGT